MRRVTESDIVIATAFPTAPETVNGYNVTLTINYKDDGDNERPIITHDFTVSAHSIAWLLLSPPQGQQFDCVGKVMELGEFQRQLEQRTRGENRTEIAWFRFLVRCQGRKLVYAIRGK